MVVDLRAKCVACNTFCITSISHATFEYQEAASAIPQIPLSLHLVPTLHQRGNAVLLAQQRARYGFPRRSAWEPANRQLGERALQLTAQ